MVPKYFEGKMCSVFTAPHCRDLYRENPKAYPQTLFRYFTGEVKSIDREGITLTQGAKQMRTWVAMQHIVAIAEEEVLDPNDPQDAKYIEACIAEAKKQQETPPPSALQGKTVDPEALAKLAADLQSKFG